MTQQDRDKASAEDRTPPGRACPCSIRIETPDQVVTEQLAVPNIGAAYDVCRQRLNETPRATVAHLYVNEMLIHTMKRRA